jgi:16S rRNA (cytosine967-C5)-methyltransferase
MTDVRVVAAKVLLDVETRDITLANALEPRRGDVAPADRGLLVELTTGVMRWRNALDAVIASASRRSVKTIEPEVLAVLRLGAYQLRYLDRVPDHASIDSSVRAVRALKRTSATSLVNATLRAIVRRGPAISLPSRPAAGAHIDAQVNYLAVTMSHPAWLVRRWITRVGFDAAESWCRFNNTTPDVTVRSLAPVTQQELISQLRDAGVAASPARYVDDAVRLEPGALGRLTPALRAGLWVQDEAAQLVARYAGVQPRERVLDLCASPGGKTLVMSSDMRGDADTPPRPIVACDHRPGRVELLAGTLRHAGVAATVVRLDARAPLPFGPVFDCVLLDAPCSGLGTVRREADLKWTRTAADLYALAATQQQMLRRAAEAVAPGGRLVYATCSSEPEENDEVVDAFLAADARFEAGPAGPLAAELLDGRGRMVTRPDRHGLELFYAASLVRRAA